MTISFFPQFRSAKSYGADGVAGGGKGLGEGSLGWLNWAVGPQGASTVGAHPDLGVFSEPEVSCSLKGCLGVSPLSLGPFPLPREAQDQCAQGLQATVPFSLNEKVSRKLQFP
jgi:hypothetical protein